MTLRLRPALLATTAAVRGVSLRAAAVVALVLVAYHYSLATLARGLSLQTPLAYLALVPLIALGLAYARLRLEPGGPSIHDRQVDWIVALVLFGITVLILVPNSTSSMFWFRRVDLLTLPLFVSGMVCLVFGVRRLWSLRSPILFLLLAWPVPYSLFLTKATGGFTDATAQLVAAFTGFVSIATPAQADRSMLMVASADDRFTVSIGSASAGLNGFVGFMLIGVAFTYLVAGSFWRRLLWLAAGLTVVFALNVGRIIAILGAGAALGEEAALDGLHPVAGTIVFTIGVVGMVAMMPAFGLHFRGADRTPRRVSPDDPRPVRRARAALVFSAALAAVLGFTNMSYARFDVISSGLADASLEGFNTQAAAVEGWETRHAADFGVAKQYFGENATWHRTLWWPSETTELSASRTLYVDVVSTDDPGALAAYNVEACYRFHGYDIVSVATTDVGAGVQAQIIDYHNTKLDSDWSALWWEWPVTKDGEVRYERVAILLSNGPSTEFRGITADGLATQSDRFVESDKFLATLAREIVAQQLTLATAAVP